MGRCPPLRNEDEIVTKSQSKTPATEPTQADIDTMAIADALEAGDTKPKLSMADTLRKHRAGYISTISSTGKHSLHNGDDIAEILAGLSPSVALSAAQAVADLAGLDIDLMAKYLGDGKTWDDDPTTYRLNLGQIRMNSANRLRGALKRGDETIETISAHIAAVSE